MFIIVHHPDVHYGVSQKTELYNFSWLSAHVPLLLSASDFAHWLWSSLIGLMTPISLMLEIIPTHPGTWIKKLFRIIFVGLSVMFSNIWEMLFKLCLFCLFILTQESKQHVFSSPKFIFWLYPNKRIRIREVEYKIEKTVLVQNTSSQCKVPTQLWLS